jgi:hypothetical protein
MVGRDPCLSGAGRPPSDTEANRLWTLKQRIINARSRRGFNTAGGTAAGDDDLWLKKLNNAWQRLHRDGSYIDAQIVDPAASDLWADLFVVRDGRRLCSVEQASSGEIELISLAGWLALNDFQAGLVLVDEPELHLHPEWQNAILPAMRELAPDAQFIVASHSDAIWDQVYTFERFLLLAPNDPRARQQTTAGPTKLRYD